MKSTKLQMLKTKTREILESKAVERNAVYLYLLIKTLKEVNRIRRTNKFIKANNLKKYSELNIDEYKSSDTLFVMGSGASINEFGDNEWNLIRYNDSIGFNFWLIHEFIPTYYMFEPTKPGELERANVFFDLLDLRSFDYKNVPIIGKYSGDNRLDLSRIPECLKNNIYMSYIKIPGNEKNSFIKAINIMKSLKLYKTSLLFSMRASISDAIFFGLKMKYKKIVLCGVDLNNIAYFYEDSKYCNRNIPVPKSVQLGVVHKTIDSTYGELTIDMVIEEINKHLLKPNGVELYIGSQKSALYPMLPYYFN